MQNQRKVHLDILRIVGAFWVLFNHSQMFYYYMTVKPTSVSYWLWVSISAFCKMAVPLFFMVSGALLLGKEETVKKVYQHRIFKVVLIIGIFSTFQYAYQLLHGGQTSVGEFIKILYKSRITSSYWFLYSYLAAIIMLPFIRRIAQNITFSELIYFFILKLVFHTALPIFEIKFSSHVNLSIDILSDNIFFMIMGYYMENKLTKDWYQKKNMISLSIACIVGMFATGAAVVLEATKVGEATENYIGCFTCVTTIWAYAIVKYICINHTFGENSAKWITYLGSCTLVVYLIGNLITDNVLTIEQFLLSHCTLFFGAIIYVLMRLGIGFLIATVLKQIPLLKKIL